MKIKLLSINIWHGGELMDNLLEFIKKEKPDIILAQEVTQGYKPNYPPRSLNTLSVFKQNFNYQFIFAPQVLWFKEPKVEQGTAIFSRFPLKKGPIIFLNNKYCYYPLTSSKKDALDYPATIFSAKTIINHQIINLVNVHGIWGFNGQDTSKRTKMIAQIIKHIKNKQNVIVGGDFNMSSDTKAIRSLEKYLVNVFKNKLTTSFNLKRKPKTGNWSKSVVDMVFVSKELKVSNFSCPKVDISDHLPLVVEITL